MSKPVYRNFVFWLIVVWILILIMVATILVLHFLALHKAKKAKLLDEQEGSAQIGMKRQPLARRERQFLEIVDRQRRDGDLRRVCCHAQRTVMEAPIRPDPGELLHPLSENTGIVVPAKVEKRAFFGKVDSPTPVELRRFLAIVAKQRPGAVLTFVHQGSQRRPSEAPHRRAGLSTEARLAKSPGIPMPKTCQKGGSSTNSYARKCG